VYQASGERRLVHEHENVKRIAVAAGRFRDKPEIIARWRTRQSFQKAAALYSRKFVPAAFGRVKDDVNGTEFLIECRQLFKIHRCGTKSRFALPAGAGVACE